MDVDIVLGKERCSQDGYSQDRCTKDGYCQDEEAGIIQIIFNFLNGTAIMGDFTVYI